MTRSGRTVNISEKATSGEMAPEGLPQLLGLGLDLHSTTQMNLQMISTAAYRRSQSLLCETWYTQSITYTRRIRGMYQVPLLTL